MDQGLPGRQHSTRFVVFGKKAKANQAAHTFAVRAWMGDRVPHVAQTPTFCSLGQRCSRRQNLVNIMQLSIDLGGIGDCARHLGA